MLPRVEFRVVSTSVSVHLGQLFEVQVILSRTHRYSVCRYFSAFVRLSADLELATKANTKTKTKAGGGYVTVAPPTHSSHPGSRRSLGRPPVDPKLRVPAAGCGVMAHISEGGVSNEKVASQLSTPTPHTQKKQRNAVVRFLKKLTKRQKLVRLPAALRFFDLDRRGAC